MTETDQSQARVVRRLDPEDAQLALARVQEQLRRQALVEQLVHKQEEGDERAELVEGLLHRQHESELRALVIKHDPRQRFRIKRLRRLARGSSFCKLG